MSTHDAGPAGFSTLLESMAQLDFFSLVLPFILSYIVFFLAIREIELFEEKQHASLIALISSFFTAQFIATNEFYQTFFVDYFGQLTIGLVGILGLFILLGLVGWNASHAKGPFMGLIIVAIVGASFATAGGFGPPLLEFDSPGADMIGPLLFDTGLIWVLVIGGVILWLGREDNNGGGGNEKGIKEFIEWGLGD